MVWLFYVVQANRLISSTVLILPRESVAHSQHITYDLLIFVVSAQVDHAMGEEEGAQLTHAGCPDVSILCERCLLFTDQLEDLFCERCILEKGLNNSSVYSVNDKT